MHVFSLKDQTMKKDFSIYGVFKLIVIIGFSGFLFACSTGIELDPDVYKQQQAEYEQEKERLTATRGVFYKEHKEELMSLTETILMLKDTATSFPDDIPSDSNYFLRGESLVKLDEYPKTRADANIARAAFVVRNKVEDSDKNYKLLDELCACKLSNSDLPCLKLSDLKLTNILNLKYVFVIDEWLKMNPKMKGSGFEGGGYVATVTCYNVKRKTFDYRYTVIAQSSDQVYTTTGYSGQRKLQNDFDLNIRKEYVKSLNKHYRFK